MNKTAKDLIHESSSLDPLKGPVCPYCQNRSILVPESEIYSKSYTGKKYWLCKPCNAYVGTHATGYLRDYPLGSLANSSLRNYRKKAHTLLDEFWKKRHFNRSEMYIWLQATMNLSADKAHIGEMDETQCMDLINHLNKLYGN